MKKSRWSSWMDSIGSFKNRIQGVSAPKKKLRIGKSRGLQLEPLEERQMLSITVNSLLGDIDTDPNTTTIYEAVTLANATPGEDTIEFDASLFGNGGDDPIARTITLENDQLSITDDLVIDGPGADLLTVAVDYNYEINRVFYVSSNVEATFSDMTITGGQVEDEGGGGIYASTGSDITVSGVVLTDNGGPWCAGGGGIYLDSASATIIDSEISGNSADGIGGTGSTINISGSLISENTGAGMLLSNSTLILSGSTISDHNGYWGAGMRLISTNATIEDSEILNNSATNGGGIYVYQGSLEATNVTFSGNTATTNGGALMVASADFDGSNLTFSDNSASASGGAAYISGSLATTIADSTFSENDADDGGAIYAVNSAITMSGTTLSDNTAVDDGAGVYLESSEFSVAHSSFYGNYATGYGGGIYGIGSDVEVAYSSVFGNYGGQGGAVRLSGTSELDIINSAVFRNSAGGLGGAIYLYNPSASIPVNILNSTIAYNHAGSVGGGIYTQGLYTLDAANSIVALNTAGSSSPNIYGSLTSSTNNLVGTDPLFIQAPSAGTDTIWGTADDEGNLRLISTSSAIDAGDNTSASGLATDLVGNDRIINGTVDIGAYEYNGDILVSTLVDELDTDYTYGDLSLREALYLAGQNSVDGIITFDPDLFTSGPGTITLDGAQLNVNSNVTIEGPGDDTLTVAVDYNYDTNRVFYVGSNVEATFSGMTITGGRVLADYGGGIYASTGSNITLDDVTLTDNGGEYCDDGGGLYLNYANATIRDSEISGNNVNYGGAGVYAYHSALYVFNTLFDENTSYSGGGIFVHTGTLRVSDDSTFTNNEADYGGAIRNYQGTVEVEDSTLQNNTANIRGAGIYNHGAILSVFDTLFDGNTAPNGAGIFDNGGSTIAVTGSTFSGNTATSSGAGIYGATNSDVSVSHSIFSSNDATNFGGGVYMNGGTLNISGSSVFSGNTAQYGGAVRGYNATIDVGDTTFQNNVASVAGGGLELNATTLDLSDSTFTANEADTGRGGGISVTAGSNVTISDSTFSENKADASNAGGGGISIATNGSVTVSSSIFSGNTTGFAGGAIRVDTGTLTVSDGTLFTGNTANYGGGIFSYAGTFNITNGATITNNTATASGGGISLNGTTSTFKDLLLTDNSSGSSGGGLIVDATSTADLINATLAGNTASSSGGGFRVLSGGTVTMANTIVATNSATTSPDVYGTLAAGSINNLIGDGTGQNLTDGTDGNQVGTSATPLDPKFVNSTNGDWSLLAISSAINAGDNTTVTNASLTEDLDGNDRVIYETVDIGAYEYNGNILVSAPLTPALSDVSNGDYSYGDLSLREAIYLASQNPGADIITFDPDLFTGGPGTITLGGTQLTVDSDVTIEGPGSGLLTIDANDLSRVFLVSSNVEADFSSITITGGFSSTGGGINGGTNSIVSISNAVISNNSADYGGGIYSYHNTVNVYDSTISGNTTTHGGGIYSNCGTIEVNGSVISHNSASYQGGGISNYYGTATIKNSLIAANTTNSYGGGIRNYHSTAEVVNSTVSGNYSGNIAGGIFSHSADESTLILKNSIVALNTAASSSYNIYGSYTPESSHNQIGGTPGFVVAPSAGPDTIWGTADDEGDYHLAHTSSIINAGDNSIATAAGLTEDLDGNARIFGDLVDMGAYEYTPTLLYWDPDGAAEGFSYGSGTWSTSDENWTTDPTGNSADKQAWDNSGNYIAVFTGTGGTVYLSDPSGAISAQMVQFLSSDYSLYESSSEELELTGGLHAIDVAEDVEAIIYTNIIGDGLTKTGDGTLIITGNSNEYTGDTIINDGVLQVGDIYSNYYSSTDELLGDHGSPGEIINNASLTFGIYGTVLIPNDISGNGTLTQRGYYNTLILTGNNDDYEGDIILSAEDGGDCTLQIGNGGTTGTLGTGNVIGNKYVDDTYTYENLALVIDRNDSISISSSISGDLSVEQQGSDTLTLSGNNTYNGATTVADGTLQLGSTNALPGGAVDVDGTLDLSNFSITISGLEGSGIVTTSGSGLVTLTVGDNDANSEFSGELEDGAAGTIALTKIGDGTFTLSGDYSASSGYSGGTTVNGGVLLAVTPDALYGYDTSGAITVNEDSTMGVVGGASYYWSVSDIQTLTSNATFDTGSFLGIDTSYYGWFEYDSVLSGPFGLNKLGYGTLALTANNTYSGNTVISEDILELQDSGTLGGSSVTSSPIYTSEYYPSQLLFNYTSATTFDKDISGDINVSQQGSGTITLSGDNDYTGTTTIYSGKFLKAGSNNALGDSDVTVNGTLDLNSYDLTIAGLDGSGVVTTSVNGTDTLIVGDNNADSQFYGLLEDGDATKIIALEKIGNGTLRLSGDYSSSSGYSGGTTVSGGVLLAETTDSLYDYTTSGAITVSDGATIGVAVDGYGDWSSTSIEDLISNATFNVGGLFGIEVSYTYPAYTYSSVLSNTLNANYGLNKLGQGTLILTANNTYNGDTVITEGILQLDPGGSLGGDAVSSSAVYSPATLPKLVFNYDTATTFSKDISGALDVTQSGSGALTLTGDNIYTGTTTVDSSTTLNLVSDLTTGILAGNGVINVPDGESVALTVGYGITDKSFENYFYGTIQETGSGTFSFTKTGEGSLYLYGSAAHSGTTTVNDGKFTPDSSWTNTGTLLIEGDGQIEYGGELIYGGAEAISGSEVAMSWYNLPESTGTTYEYQISTDGVNYYDVVDDEEGAATDTSLIISGLKPYTNYYVRAVASHTDGSKEIYNSGMMTMGPESLGTSGWYRITSITCSGECIEYEYGTVTKVPVHPEVPSDLVPGGISDCYMGPYRMPVDTCEVIGAGGAGEAVRPAVHLIGDTGVSDHFYMNKEWTYSASPKSAILQSFQGLVTDGSVPQFDGSGSITVYYYYYEDPGNEDFYSFDPASGGYSATYRVAYTINFEFWTPTDDDSDPFEECDECPTSCGEDTGSGVDPGCGVPTFDSGYCTMEMKAVDRSGGASACGGGGGTGLTYNSGETHLDTGFGAGWSDVDQLPELILAQNTVAARFGAENLVWFDDQYDDTYAARYTAKDTLVHDTVNDLFILTKSDGTVYEFFDADQTAHTPGSFYRSVVPDGTTIEITAWNATNGKVQEVLNKTSPTSQAYQKRVFTYITTDDGVDRVQTITLLEYSSDTFAWDNIRIITYDYYGDGDTSGLTGDLKSIYTQEWNAVASDWDTTGDTDYFRYYTENDAENGAFEHGLKRVILANAYASAESYATGLLTTVDQLTDEQIANFTCFYYEYDADGRVTERVVFGESSATSYDNTLSGNTSGFNSWYRKSVETQLDGTTHTVYTNFLGSVLLADLYDPEAGVHTLEYNRYDDTGRLVLTTDTSAFDLYESAYYDESLPDLVGYDSGDSSYLSNTDGLFNLTSYYDTNGNGAAEGYIYQMAVAEGESTSRLTFGQTNGPILVAQLTYESHTVDSTTIYVIDSKTTYSNENGTGAATTEYDYAWQADSFQPREITVTLPEVSVEQNGSDTSNILKTWYDSNGNLTWSMNEAGRVAYMEYDSLTGQPSRVIEDIDAATASSFGLISPASWTLPASDGINATTDYEYDLFGRLTKILGPVHTADIDGTPTSVRTATWTIYNDADHETRLAQGYVIASTSAEVILGPISITKTDLDGRTTDEIEVAYTGTVANLATATISQSDYIAWTSYQYTKTRKTSMWVYDNIPTTNGDIGTSGTNYELTTYGYESYGEAGLMGRMNKVVTPDGTITRYVYDSLGNVTEIWMGTNDTGATDDVPCPATPGLNDMVCVISCEYDADGNLMSTTEYPGGIAENITTTYQYDWRGRPTDELTGADVVNHYEYDNLGHTILVETYASDDFTLTTSELRTRTENLYDALGRVYESQIYEVDPTTGVVGSHLTSETWYDERGQVEQTTNPLGQATTYEYDGLGQLTKVTQPDPDGAGAELAPWTVYAYDDAGNLTSITDRLSHSTSYTYDPIGRKVSVTDANNDTTEYTYDAAGYLASLTDPGGNETSWTYDDTGLVLTETNELADIRYFEYDEMGRLAEKTDRNGLVTEYTYDFLGNRDGELWKDGQTTLHTFTYTYDNLGRMLSASDSGATYGYKYDTASCVYEETQTLDGLTPTIVLERDYNDIGLLSQTTATIGGTADAVTDYTYDGFGRLSSIQQYGITGGNAVAEKRVDYTYDNASQWDTITRYADLAATDLVAVGDYDYDLTSRLTSLTYTKGATTLVSHDWTFDTGNNMTQYVNSIDGTVDYFNDNAGQLTDAYYGSGLDDEGYTYDDNGNRLTKDLIDYTIGDNNQLVSDGTYRYAYDDEGNRILKFVDTDSSGTLNAGDTDITEYEWDYRNRLTTATEFDDYADYVAEDPSQVIEYTYDYQNRLIGKTLDSDGDGTVDSRTIFVQDGNQIVAQFDKTGTGDAAAADLSHRYLWGAAVDQILADESVDNLSAEGDVIWPLVDHLNTTRDLAEYDVGLDETTIANHRTFSAYGELTSETGPADIIFDFTGRLFDEDTGLQNNLNRWYDATVGCWISEDPIGFEAGDFNVYRYVNNAPVSWTDPKGTAIITTCIVAGGIAGGIAGGVLTDWGTDYLSDAQEKQVGGMLSKLKSCAKKAGRNDILDNLNAMTVAGIFEKGKIPGDGTSETRNGRCFGYSNRTILSADFFDASRSRKSQLRTLLHESYHAGTEDWTEKKSYKYASAALAALKKVCPKLY